MSEQPIDPDQYFKANLFTGTYYRGFYPAGDPKHLHSSAAGKSVLITGGSCSIGKGIFLSFTTAGGTTTVIPGRTQSLLEAISSESISPKTEVLPVACDITDESFVISLFAQLKARVKRLVVVVRNAGIWTPGTQFRKIGKAETKYWWNDFEAHVKGTYLIIHHFLTSFPPNLTFPSTIISITGSCAFVTATKVSSYSISKLSLIRLIECLTTNIHPSAPSLRIRDRENEYYDRCVQAVCVRYVGTC
ncbi:NAD(P)-binding protein [Zopfia rhizophila CBS 207.26]|uniref:NAD(P)-binding protein n=1 Tax=Zopfia rhizophila CBS 207.26 TaxID=1314779 RepID=A0A6A6E7S4_9PEZI|nr:NAD(P)-binding protein [Zopfia rhizophila CBS 207.26]